eukprot:1608547-Amphidinium_carterae.3
MRSKAGPSVPELVTWDGVSKSLVVRPCFGACLYSHSHKAPRYQNGLRIDDATEIGSFAFVKAELHND